MTDSHEPSYYEIALTNRQVVVAFVILLACLMGTFLAGVWVGRGEGGGPAAAQTAEAVPEAAEGDIQELDFFGGGESAGEEAAAAPAPPREDPVVQRNRRQAAERGASPGADDLAGGEGPAISEDDRPRLTPEERRQRRAARQAAAEAREPATPPRQEAARQEPARQEAARQEPTRQAAADPAPPGGRPVEGPVVQVFSSRDREQAQGIVDRLTDGGQPAYLSPVDVEGQTMYRVRIGPFRDRTQAERVAEQVKRAYRLDTWITQ